MFVRTTLLVAGLAWSTIAADTASAVDQASPSFRHRAGAFSALGAGPLQIDASQPRFSSSIVALGGIADHSLFAGSESLRSALPGIAWILVGASPSLDVDGDGLPNLLDPDDDGDGVLDADETNTGAFVSPNNTGTSPWLADSDADGFGDGVELAAGSDPTDPTSRPLANKVPLLGGLLRFVLLLALLGLGTGFSILRRGRSS